jgi:dinuclear metal center YbgI/SA1388 family protein
MTSGELDLWFSRLLEPQMYKDADPSQNGIQVDNDGADITRVAFAVDACQSTIERAAKAGAGMLFVHHGIFWGEPYRIAGIAYRRIKTLMDQNIALYASHLPLDAHPDAGNNSGIAQRLGLVNVQPFGEWRGLTIGFRGETSADATLDDLLGKLFPDGKKPLHVLPFGPKAIRSVGVISGGASDEIDQAIALSLDLYITGEIGHEAYHVALENKINVIAGGHYQTETVGIRLVAERLGRETGIDTVFIDVPTGL